MKLVITGEVKTEKLDVAELNDRLRRVLYGMIETSDEGWIEVEVVDESSGS